MKEILSHAVYKYFARKRPEEMNQDDVPFSLAVNNTLKADSLARNGWFKSGAVCINKLNDLMTTMVQKAEIEASKSQLQKGNDPDAK